MLGGQTQVLVRRMKAKHRALGWRRPLGGAGGGRLLGAGVFSLGLEG